MKQTPSLQSGLGQDIMLKGQKQLTNRVLKGEVRENPYITRQRVLRSYIKFQTKVAQKQSICMVKEWDCPDLISPEEFKTGYLDPLKRAVDNFLSTAVYWKESNLITEGELAKTQSLWQRVALYIEKQ